MLKKWNRREGQGRDKGGTREGQGRDEGGTRDKGQGRDESSGQEWRAYINIVGR
jgi:hypothetical protein